jgi:hypothetical protein
VSAVLAKVIERCLEKDPEARFASVHSLVQRLEAFGPPHHEGITKRIEAINSAPRSERIMSMETPPRSISRAPLPTLGSQESQELSVEVKLDGSGPVASSTMPQGPARSRRGAVLFALAVIAAGGIAAGVMVTRRARLDTTRATPPAETPTAQAEAPEVPSAVPQPLLMGVPAPALSAMVDAAATPMAADVDAAAPDPSSAASIPKIVRTAPVPQRAPKKHK